MRRHLTVVMVVILLLYVFAAPYKIFAADSCDMQTSCDRPPDDPSSPGNDNPDDNYAVDSGNPPQEPYFVADPAVTILTNGFKKQLASLLGRLKIGSVSASDDGVALLNGSNGVLLIPSGGLFGMENSAFFKASLDEYVKQGGTLVVLSQQHGYEFGVLPVPQEADGSYRPVSGYGWTEDQSCFTDAVYIDTWQQFLSGQSRVTPTLNVDGYLTSYPSNATVVLRRTKNGQPAMIMYDYGLGKVIATSMYTDSAYGRSQASPEEISLIRDMVAWGKRPATLPEGRLGEAVSLNITTVNNTSLDAASVKLTVLDPDRKVVSEQTLSTGMAAGQSTAIPFTYQIAVIGPLGIWHVDYTLIDANGNVIQPQAETDTGRFAVSNQPANPYKSPDFNFSVQSNAEEFVIGNSAAFTFNLWNNTGTDRQIKATWSLPHHFAYQDDHFNNTVTVPAHGMTNFSYILSPVQRSERLGAWFYDESGKEVGRGEKGILVTQADVDFAVKADKTSYTSGNTVNLTIYATNKTRVGYVTNIKVMVKDTQNINVYSQDFDSVTLTPLGSSMQLVNFTLPELLSSVIFNVRAEAFDSSGRLIGLIVTPLRMDNSIISVAAVLPSVYTVDNPLSFSINNAGIVSISSIAFAASMKDPAGAAIFSANQTITSLQGGTTTPVNLSAGVSNLAFGNYKLLYSVNYNGMVKGAEKTIPNTALMSGVFDKPSYKARDNATFTADIKNTGAFNIDGASVSVAVPDAGSSEGRLVSLPQGANQSLSFSFLIPSGITPGQHDLNMAITLPSGSAITKTIKFTVPSSELSLSYAGSDTVYAGDAISLFVENTGGVDTSYVAEQLKVTDVNGIVLYQATATGDVMVGEKKALTVIQIPSQAASGSALVKLGLRDTKTGILSVLNKVIQINGLNANLTARTDKDAYLSTDPVSSLLTLANGNLNIDGGVVEVNVSKQASGNLRDYLPKLGTPGWWPMYAPGDVEVASDGSVYVFSGFAIMKFDASGNYITRWGSYGDGDGQFGPMNYMATGTDGALYAVDPYNNRIQKFDGNGKLLAKWGSYGGNNGQFNNPQGIAIGPDGSVYVADTGNSRIQKFDGNGNFIAKWGSSGTGAGQFKFPVRIAASSDGMVYVVESGYNSNNRIQKFDGNGNFINMFGSPGTGDGQFTNIVDMVIASDGSLYVLDNQSWSNHSIQKFDANGGFVKKQVITGVWFNGMAVAANGNVYVTDGYGNSLDIYSSGGTLISIWATSGSDNGVFSGAGGVAVSNDGFLYVADTGNDRIQKFDANGNFLIKWGSYGTGNGQFKNPTVVAAGLDGSIYVADAYNHRIQKFDANGNYISQWGRYGNGDGQFMYPKSVAIGPDNYIYVIDSGNSRIQKFDANGNYVSQWGSYGNADGQFVDPTGVAIGPDNYIYVIDYGNSRIQKFDGSGNFVLKWGSFGLNDGQFFGPKGVVVDKNNTVYVMEDFPDTYTIRIQAFDSKGVFLYRWGTVGYSSGGGVRGIAISSDGTLYVPDTRYNRILRLDVSFGKLYSATIPISQLAAVTQDYASAIPALNTTGKLLLDATLKNSLGQIVSASTHPFYIVSGNTVLLLDTDKKLYKPGEIVMISGEVRNLAAVNFDNATFTILSGADTIATQTISVPASGSYPFASLASAGAEGIVTLTGTVSQNSSVLTEVSDKYEVAKPALTLSLNTPDVVGSNPFDISVELKNIGKVDTIVQTVVTGAQVADTQQMTIPAGQSKLLQYNGLRTTNTATYAVNVTGDVTLNAIKTVSFGEAAGITLSPTQTYAEGAVSVPVTITNTGRISEGLSVTYTLTGPSGALSTQTKTYYLPIGTSLTDTISFSLVKGSYSISAQGSIAGASASSTFAVLKTVETGMSLNVGAINGGVAPVSVGVTNNGLNSLSGEVRMIVQDASGNIVWRGAAPIAYIVSTGAANYPLNIVTSALAPGAYVVTVGVYDSAGVLLTSSVSGLTVTAAAFNVTVLSGVSTFNAGATGNMAGFTFRVQNTGSQEGEATLSVRAFDLVDSTVKDWIKPGEWKDYFFPVDVPADYEDKDYYADYSLNGVPGQVKYHVNGIKITVNASLDKRGYYIGDTAVLTIQVTDNRVSIAPPIVPMPPSPMGPGMMGPMILSPAPAPSQTTNPDINMFARVNFAGFEAKQAFTLGTNPSATMQFNVPVAALTGEKLFYGIYQQEGKSVHLNSLYVYGNDGTVNIIADKQVYNPGETVSMTITGTGSGTLVLSGPGGFSDTFAFTGSASRAFVLPSKMTAGTYTIGYQITDATGKVTTGNYPIDVAGIAVKVTEATLDKAKYAPYADVSLKLTIESNTNTSATLKTWFVDPTGNYTVSASKSIMLGSDAPTLEGITVPFTASVLGIHKLVYGVYDGDMLLTSGAEAFDVGDVVLLGVSTDRTDYPNGMETVNANVSLYGNAPAAVELFVDGASAGNFSAQVNGFLTQMAPLAGISPGAHKLKAVLTSDGLTSTKETSFVYGSSLPDLTVSLSSGGAVSIDNKMVINVTVANQGKTASAPTTITLYDAAVNGGIGVAFGTFQVDALAPGATASYSFSLNVLGRAGAQTIYAKVNDGNTVYEFNTSNNTASMLIDVPDAAFYTTVASDVNYTGDIMDIIGRVTNLSSKQLSGLSLSTKVTDANGMVAYTATTAVPVMAAAIQIDVHTLWDIPVSLAEGIYTVSQTLNGLKNGLPYSYGTSSRTTTIKPGRDFTIAADVPGLRVESGGLAQYTLTLMPIRGFTDAVVLNVSGYPQGMTVQLSKDPLTPPESANLTVAVSPAVAAGTYVITVTASGGGKTHSVDLKLDVIDFTLAIDIPGQTIQEIETARFDMSLTPLNGFDSPVTLNIEGLPRGVKAAFDATTATLPAQPVLTVRTSKWLLPGVYNLKITARGTTAYHEKMITMTVNRNPLITPGIVTAPGPGPKNDAAIKKFNTHFVEIGSFYGLRTGYGADAVVADVNGDGIDEIIVGSGPNPNGNSSIDIFKKDGTLITGSSLGTFASGYGVTLAAADIGGDWTEEIAVGTGPDPNGIGRVKVYRYDGGVLKDTGIDIYPYSAEGYKYGVNIAFGDIDGDGVPELITAPGPDPNAVQKIKVFKIDTSLGIGQWKATEAASFTAVFDAKTRYGANIASVDLNGDGLAEIIVGAGPDPNLTGQNVKVYTGAGAFTGKSFAAGLSSNYGAYVSAGDLYLDGKAEIVIGSGPDPKNLSAIRVYSYEDGLLLGEFHAYPDTTKYGVKPFVGRIGE